MDNTEYIRKKEEILSRFRKEFIEQQYNKDASLNKIIEYLIRDGNPYEIIELLIENQQRLVNELYNKLERQPIKIHVESIEEFKREHLK